MSQLYDYDCCSLYCYECRRRGRMCTPKFSYVALFPDNMEIPNVRIPPDFSESRFSQIFICLLSRMSFQSHMKARCGSHIRIQVHKHIETHIQNQMIILIKSENWHFKLPACDILHAQAWKDFSGQLGDLN